MLRMYLTFKESLQNSAAMNNGFFADINTAQLTFKVVFATLFGWIAKFLGGFDNILITLITLIVIDYVTGVVSAVYEKKLSSSVGYKGIVKKVLMLLVVGLAVSLQNVLPQGVPLREITILFFTANEGLSVLENAAKVIPLPQKLKDVLWQLRKKSDENTEADEEKDK